MQLSLQNREQGKIPQTLFWTAWVSNSAIETSSEVYNIGVHLWDCNTVEESVNMSSLNTPTGGRKILPSENQTKSQTLQ